MNPVVLHPVIYWANIGMITILFISTVFFVYLWWKLNFCDKSIYIDKSDRWTMEHGNVYGSKIKRGKSTYFNKGGILNRKGKSLHIFSEGNPAPMKIGYKKTEWLDSESLMSAINNELIKMMVTPRQTVKDIFIYLGAVGGLIAGIASVLILAKTYGVI